MITKRGPLKKIGPKYKQVIDSLSSDILAGKYRPGQKFPSEAVLVRQFATSRITVGRAVRELKDRGLVERIAGSGTYVKSPIAPTRSALFGLLIPDLGETEIFEPICNGMARARQANENALLWGRTEPERSAKEEQALALCRQYVERNVSGVFFAPLELTSGKDETNLAIVKSLEKAHIPIVLLDRCFLPYPERSQHDLVGIDNRRAGYLVTEHLLKAGCRRIAFIAQPYSASTVKARIAGFRDALFSYDVAVKPDFVQFLESTAEADLKPVLNRLRPEAVVCMNDRTAGHVMKTALNLGYKIPKDLRIVGFDDVEYAKLLPIPLTTIRQPCREIGIAAMATMLDRIEQPTRHVRDILLDCELIVRESSGSK